jgi:hypothetical protein
MILNRPFGAYCRHSHVVLAAIGCLQPCREIGVPPTLRGAGADDLAYHDEASGNVDCGANGPNGTFGRILEGARKTVPMPASVSAQSAATDLGRIAVTPSPIAPPLPACSR